MKQIELACGCVAYRSDEDDPDSDIEIEMCNRHRSLSDAKLAVVYREAVGAISRLHSSNAQLQA